jgi:RNA polymerase sigma-70 factor (ECF subfamily)
MTIPLARSIAMDGDSSPPPAEPDPELALLAELRAGRPRAAERLAEATYRKLYSCCHRITGDADEAADLVQETYRKAWQGLAGFRGESRFSTWLFRIAWTTHLKRVRRPKLVVPLEPGRAEVERDPEPSPEDAAGSSERGAHLRAAVAALPVDLRYAVVAHYWAEVPVRELAAADGVTPMAIRKRLAKALRRLAAELEEKTR